MATARKLEVSNFIFASIKKRSALGNSHRKLKDVAADLLNATGESPDDIAKGTYLCPSTVKRVMDCEDNYSPRADTLERCFRYCNASVVFEETMMKKNYLNQPKEKEED